jgi:hypothetical protein
MLKGLFQSLKKSSRLKKVSKKLSKPLDTRDIFKIATQGNKKDKDLDELIDIAESDEYVKMVMNEYRADRQTLKDLYSKLTLVGAGQYAKGHYVAASCLVYPLTIKYLLEHFDGENFSINGWDDKNSTMHIAYRLIEYFEKGETGEVN